MNKFIHNINSNKRLTAEEHVSLYLYSVYISGNNELKYKKFVITQSLIEKFNIMNECRQKRIKFEMYLKEHQIKIDQFINVFNKKPWVHSKPVIWNDREKSSYYIENLTLSHKFEVFIDCIFREKGIDIGLYYDTEGQYNKGESKVGIEIKYDNMSLQTGNLYIEYKEKLNAENKNWVNSGIFKNDNTKYFLIGTPKEFFIMRKSDLLELKEKISKKDYTGDCKLKKCRRGTSLGFIIPIKEARSISLEVDEVISELRL